MLTGYDAKAISEMMGLAFVRGDGLRSPSNGAVARGGPFVIQVEGCPTLIVEIGKKDNRRPNLDRDRVSSPTVVFIEKAVESGLPRAALRHLTEWLAGGDKAKAIILEHGVASAPSQKGGTTRLSLLESELTERVARLSVLARRALGTESEAREFMTAPHPELDGRSPMDAAKTDLGARRTEQLLNALEYGLAV